MQACGTTGAPLRACGARAEKRLLEDRFYPLEAAADTVRRPRFGTTQPGTSALSSTSSMLWTGTISRSVRTCSGKVSRSRTFSFGMSTVFTPCAVRREKLLLESADRQHPSAQRDLTRHRQVASHRTGR